MPGPDQLLPGCGKSPRALAAALSGGGLTRQVSPGAFSAKEDDGSLPRRTTSLPGGRWHWAESPIGSHSSLPAIPSSTCEPGQSWVDPSHSSLPTGVSLSTFGGGLQRRHKVVLAHFAAICAVSSFGAISVVAKVVLNDGIDPFVFGLYRDGISLPLLLLATTATGSWSRLVSWQDLRRFAAVGLTGIYGNQLCFIIGLNLTNADLASMYQPLAPFLTAVLAVWPWHYEKVSWRKMLGVIVGCSGVLMLVAPAVLGRLDAPCSTLSDQPCKGIPQSTTRYVLGNVCLALSAIFASVFFLLQKPLFQHYPPLMITTLGYSVALVAMFLTCTPKLAKAQIWQVTSPAEWGGVLYAAIVCSCMAYGLLTWANQFLDATVVSAYGILQPVVTGVLAYVVLHEPLTWPQGGACVIILMGLVAVGSSNSAKEITTCALPQGYSSRQYRTSWTPAMSEATGSTTDFGGTRLDLPGGSAMFEPTNSAMFNAAEPPHADSRSADRW